MTFFSKDWHEYINQEWFIFTNNSAYFDLRNFNDIKEYNGNYNNKLVEEFEKYYNAKKLYISMYKEFENKFKYYERVLLLNYNDELTEYKKRVDYYSKELCDNLKLWLNDVEFKKIEGCDFRLLLLGYLDKNYIDNVKFIPKILNRANCFLKNIDDFLYDIKELEVINHDVYKYNFRDTVIYEFDNNHNDLILKIDVGYSHEFDENVIEINLIVSNTAALENIDLYLLKKIYEIKMYLMNGKSYCYIKFVDGVFMWLVSEKVIVKEVVCD